MTDEIKIVEIDMKEGINKFLKYITVEKSMEKPVEGDKEALNASHEVIKSAVRKGHLKDNWPGQWDHIKEEIRKEEENNA